MSGKPGDLMIDAFLPLNFPGNLGFKKSITFTRKYRGTLSCWSIMSLGHTSSKISMRNSSNMSKSSMLLTLYTRKTIKGPKDLFRQSKKHINFGLFHMFSYFMRTVAPLHSQVMLSNISQQMECGLIIGDNFGCRNSLSSSLGRKSQKNV
jgi:hypothetical protein